MNRLSLCVSGLSVLILSTVVSCRISSSGGDGETTVHIQDGDEEATVELGGVRIGKDGIEISGSVSGDDGNDEGAASGTIRIGRDGIEIAGSASGTDGDESGRAEGTISVGRDGVQIRGDGEGLDGGGSGSVSLDSEGIRIEGDGYDETGRRRTGSVGVGPGGIVLDSSRLPSSCQELCDGWDRVRQSQSACAVEVLEERNYPLSRTSTCQVVNSAVQCVACAGSLQLTARDCSAVLDECF